MLYRYEHSIRFAENGRMIAMAEELPVTDAVVACLLHDVGYRECGDDWRIHPQISADIAAEYSRPPSEIVMISTDLILSEPQWLWGALFTKRQMSRSSNPAKSR